MKNLIPLLILVLAAGGCNQNSSKVEIIKLNDSNYLTAQELDNAGKVFSGNYRPELYDKIDKRVKDAGFKDVELENYDLTLFVNESGEPDKIIVINAPDDKIVNIITGVLTDQVFNIATKDNKPVKYRFQWSYSSEFKVEVEQMPEPIGGISVIQKNIVYPETARRAGIQGKVYVTAYINEAGDVVKTEIIKGIGAGCDQAAENAIKKVKFVPGMQRGVPVKVQVSIPVIFKLSNK